jgi:hypothetical protein
MRPADGSGRTAVQRRRDFRLQDDRWAYSSPLPDWSGTRELVWERLE